MKFAVIVFPGSNCDHDAHYALTEVLGQQVNLVWHKDQDLGGADVGFLTGTTCGLGLLQSSLQ